MVVEKKIENLKIFPLDTTLDQLKTWIKIEPVNLLLHNQEDEGKTEEATETKKRQAREKEGRTHLTQELPQSMLLIVGFLMLFFLSDFYLNALMENMSYYLENPNAILINSNNAPDILLGEINFLSKLLLPIAPILFIVVSFFTLVQTRFLISVKPLTFDIKKINPSLKNFLEKTIFSRTQIINSVKIFLKLLVTFSIIAFFFFSSYQDFAFLIFDNLWQAFFKIAKQGFWLMILLSAIGLILAVPDWFLQRTEFLRKLRMTKEEIKREIKEFEGDPKIKEKQRQRARSLAMGKMFDEVQNADVVVTNPYHFACAIVYTWGEMDAPKLLAKGADADALRIRNLAKEHNVPIVENKPLARKLFANVRVGETISVDLYEAVLAVLLGLERFRLKQMQLIEQS